MFVCRVVVRLLGYTEMTHFGARFDERADYVVSIDACEGIQLHTKRSLLLRIRSIRYEGQQETPVPVLAPGNGKTKTGRLWTYVRDDRPAGCSTAPAVWFTYSEDRKGEHPRRHLKDFKGALQADAYSGFHHLYGDGAIYEVACWAHTTSVITQKRP